MNTWNVLNLVSNTQNDHGIVKCLYVSLGQVYKWENSFCERKFHSESFPFSHVFVFMYSSIITCVSDVDDYTDRSTCRCWVRPAKKVAKTPPPISIDRDTRTQTVALYRYSSSREAWKQPCACPTACGFPHQCCLVAGPDSIGALRTFLMRPCESHSAICACNVHIVTSMGKCQDWSRSTHLIFRIETCLQQNHSQKEYLNGQSIFFVTSRDSR